VMRPTKCSMFGGLLLGALLSACTTPAPPPAPQPGRELSTPVASADQAKGSALSQLPPPVASASVASSAPAAQGSAQAAASTSPAPAGAPSDASTAQGAPATPSKPVASVAPSGTPTPAPVLRDRITSAGGASTAKAPPPLPNVPAVPLSADAKINATGVVGYTAATATAGAAKAHALSTTAKDIRQRCALPRVYFDHNSAQITEESRMEVARVARCFTKGAFHDRHVTLVGHADRTGEARYNLDLGERRAASVKALLVAHGLPVTRITMTTRGAAAQTPPGYTYADDRRVDILISK